MDLNLTLNNLMSGSVAYSRYMVQNDGKDACNIAKVSMYIWHALLLNYLCSCFNLDFNYDML